MHTIANKVQNPACQWAFRLAMGIAVLINIPLGLYNLYESTAIVSAALQIMFYGYLALVFEFIMKKTSNTIIATLLLASTICAYAGEMPAQAGSVNASINLSECKNHPNYPLDSARNEEQGTVIIRFLVSTEGKVIESVIERSSGFHALDMAAFDFISGCDKFKPGVVNGKPVEAWARVSYEWKIE